jgi:cytochrome c-type biogenesis protein CcmH/NrfG
VVLACLLIAHVLRTEFIDMNIIRASVFRQVVKADPDNLNALLFLAKYDAEAKRWDEAIGYLCYLSLIFMPFASVPTKSTWISTSRRATKRRAKASGASSSVWFPPHPPAGR